MSLKMLRRALASGVLALGIGASGGAKAIDIIPGDYTVMPSGTTLGLMYFGYSGNSHLRVFDTNVPNSNFDVATVIPRILYYSDIGGVPIAVQAFLPSGGFTQHKIGGAQAGMSNGIGDLTGGFTAFALSGADKPGGTNLGVTAYVSGPTGAYNATRPFNIGTGTWTFFPQVGLIQNFGNGFFLDLAADVTVYADHSELGSNYRQNETYQFQGYLRKNFSPTTFVAAGYNGRFGGKQFIDGINTGLRTESNGVRLFAGMFVTPTVQVTAVGGFDVTRNEGGFRNDFTAQIRLLKVFPPAAPPAPATPVVTKY